MQHEIRSIEESLRLAGHRQAQRHLAPEFLETPPSDPVLAAMIQMFLQMTGVNALAFYQATIFRAGSWPSGTIARIMSASVFTWQTMCSPLGVLTIDRFVHDESS